MKKERKKKNDRNKVTCHIEHGNFIFAIVFDFLFHWSFHCISDGKEKKTANATLSRMPFKATYTILKNTKKIWQNFYRLTKRKKKKTMWNLHDCIK